MPHNNKLNREWVKIPRDRDQASPIFDQDDLFTEVDFLVGGSWDDAEHRFSVFCNRIPRIGDGIHFDNSEKTVGWQDIAPEGYTGEVKDVVWQYTFTGTENGWTEFGVAVLVNPDSNQRAIEDKKASEPTNGR